MKTVILAMLALTSLTAIASDSRIESFKLSCFVSAVIQKPDGSLSRENIVQEEKPISFEEGSNRAKIDKSFEVNGEKFMLYGYSSLETFGEEHDIRVGGVTAKLENPAHSSRVMAIGGMQIMMDMSDLGVRQGAIGNSSAMIIDGKSDIVFGCILNRKLSEKNQPIE